MNARTIIIGAGRIGSFLHSLRPNAKLMHRQDAFPQDSSGPIYLCVRNDDLPELLAKVPKSRYQDLIFLQNGMILPFLQAHQLEQATQGILYFAVAKIGAPAEDGNGTVVWGKWSDDLCQLLASGGIECRAVSQKDFLGAMTEKLLWNAIFGLLCEAHHCTVGEVISSHQSEALELLSELQPIVEDYCHIHSSPNLWQNLRDYTLKIPDYQGALKELKWRNGWFLQQKSTPTHSRLLALAMDGKTN